MSEQAQETSAETEGSKKLTATLFIGIGGTGMQILQRIRRNILHADWGAKGRRHRIGSLADFPLAQFLSIDLDAGDTKDSEHTSIDDDPLYKLVEWQKGERIFEKLDHLKYVADEQTLSRHSHVKAWLPMADLSRFDLSKGAGQIRALSRLFFYDKIDPISSSIRQKMRKLKENVSRENDFKALGFDMQPNAFRIVIVGSFAGGTGSGAFLDMGWLCKLIADTEITGGQSKSVDLVYVLPTMFGVSRNLANGYVALLELEAAMKGKLAKQYVEHWDRYDNSLVPNQPRPFDDVYLIDSENLGGLSTANKNDVFNVIADTLFEDFASEAMAVAKSSQLVNQTKYKLPSYNPPMSERYKDKDKDGEMQLMFSRAYSSFGQAVIDTQGTLSIERQQWDIGSVVLRHFFGIGEKGGKDNFAKPEATKEFVEKYLKGGLYRIEFDPNRVTGDTAAKIAQEGFDQNGIQTVQALNAVLAGGRQERLSASLIQDINSTLDTKIAAAGSNYDEWAKEISQYFVGLRSRVMRTEESKADTTEDLVSIQRHQLFESLKADVRTEVFRLLDNHELGGITYVESLVVGVKAALEGPGGIADGLVKLADKTAVVAENVANREIGHYVEQLGNMGFFSKEASARIHFTNAKLAMQLWVEWYLYSVAARQAAVLMKDDVCRWLGDPQGTEDGLQVWSGLMGEIYEGRRNVQRTLDEVGTTMALLDDSAGKRSACYIRVEVPDPAGERTMPNLDEEALKGLAKEAFREFNGTEKLFERIRSIDGRKKLASEVVKAVEVKLGGKLAETRQTDALLSYLAGMTSAQRQTLFKRCITAAMPWVKKKSINMEFKDDQFNCFIGVPDARAFEEAGLLKDFKDQLTPPGTWVKIVETGIAGRITVYVELAGFPLDYLADVSTWRAEARKCQAEVPPLPLHTHKDTSLFRPIMPPTEGELDKQANDFKLYLKGVMLGVLTRSRGEPNPEGWYFVSPAKGQKEAIGNERRIRIDGLTPEYIELITEQIGAKLQDCTPAQFAALSSLVDYYAAEIFSISASVEDQKTVKRKGFPHVITLQLKQEFAKRALDGGMDEDDIKHIDEALIPYDNQTSVYDLKALNRWTAPIADSETDGFRSDVGKDPAPKRYVLKDFFTPGWLEGMIAPKTAAAQVAPLSAIATPVSGSAFCVNCGSPVPSGAKFCPGCGKPQATPTVCNKCNADLMPGAQFCMACGNKV